MPPEDERLQFKTIDICLYNLRLVTILGLVVGSLVYFPLKVHFFLSIRSLHRFGEEQHAVLLAQESARS